MDKDSPQPTTDPIAVLGAGSWGTALAILLARNGVPTRLWSYDAAQVAAMLATRRNVPYLPDHPLDASMQITADLAACVSGVNDILVVVPSAGFRDTIAALPPLLTNPRIVWGTKGLDPNQQMLHEVVAEFFSEKTPMAALSGPSFAKEVASDLPTAVSVATNNRPFAESLVARFHNPRFRVYINDDLTGVELCGVVKNILAIAVGMCDGLGFGANARCALITRGLAEMLRLMLALGGKPETLMHLAGVGDTILTCTDNQSRNRRFGLAVAKELDVAKAQADIGQAVEGYRNTKQVHTLAAKHQVDMPIVSSLYGILYEGKDITEQVTALLERSPKVE